MAIKLYVPMPFNHFRYESDIIGRMVIEYGELEWVLCLLVRHVTGDMDVAVKSLYRARGESQRLDIADALIRNRINPAIKQIYEETLSHVRACLTIRNRYAHSNWIRAGSDKLAYIDIEELAKRNDPVDFDHLTHYHLTKELVEDQARFFNDVMQNMTYLNMEIQYLNGDTTITGFHYVTNIKRPMKAAKLEL